jgi:hypothetical protein
MSEEKKKKGNKTERRGEGGQPGNTNALKWTEAEAMKLGGELVTWMKPKFVPDPKHKPKKGERQKMVDAHGLNIFFEKFLLIEKGLPPGTLSYLDKNFKSFSNLKKTAKRLQEIKLKEYGVHRKLDKSVVIFLLKCEHGLTEKQDTPEQNNFTEILKAMASIMKGSE